MSRTPGPWRIEEFRKGSYLITARNAGTAREGLVAQHVPGSANARLIAAAPELYEEVEEARAFYCLVRLNLESSEQDENRLKALLKLACNGIKRIERLQGEIRDRA